MNHAHTHTHKTIFLLCHRAVTSYQLLRISKRFANSYDAACVSLLLLSLSKAPYPPSSHVTPEAAKRFIYFLIAGSQLLCVC